MENKKTLYRITLIAVSVLFAFNANAQKDKKFIRKGNKNFDNENFQESEILYRKAIDEKFNNVDAQFNLGDALYRQDKFEEAVGQFQNVIEQEDDKMRKAAMYHNLGNSLLSMQKVEESIGAFKNALRNNPRDIETKYNLAFAQNLLEKQKNQKNQQNQQNKDQQDQKDNQDKQDQKDKKDKNKDKKDQDQQDKDQQDKNDQQKKKDQKKAKSKKKE